MTYKDLLSTLKTCPFCAFKDRIINENENAFLTYSIAPYHQDHLLVIPKKHVEHILELDEKVMQDINRLQSRGMDILKKLGHKNISLLVREGDENEKSIAHTHFHIIPDVLLESSDHLGVERQVLTEDEIALLFSRIESVK